jgi:hypothetical protein
LTCTPTWGEEIRAAVTEGVGPVRAAALRAHRHECPACAAAYDEATVAVDALEGHADGLPESVRADLGASLFDQLAAEGALDESPAPTTAEVRPFVRPGAPRTTRPGRRTLWAGLGAALAAGLALTLLPGGTPDEVPLAPPGEPGTGVPEFSPRGGARAGLGFGLYCVRVDTGTPRIESAASSGDARPARCALDDRLQFTYSVDAGHPRPPTALSLVGVGPEGEVAWYWPRAEGAPPLTVPARQEALPGSFELAVRHRPGRWRVYGIFGHRPVPRDALAAQPGRGAPAALAALEEAGDFAVTEASLDIAAPGDPPEGPRPR